MSLQFIFGNSGAGKSRYLYEQIVKESMEHPQTNYLVLVPEQFTMQTQKELCTAHPRHGIMNIDVLSFVRLSHRVFEEVGKEVRRILDDEGKSLILRKIAGKYEGELKVLGGNLKKQGYISEVKSVISEFTQYGIGFEELDEFLETLEPESYLYYKLSDIRKVYEGFEDYLADKYITKEELLDVLSNVVPDSALLKDSVVVLDGFTGFTPVQNKLLGELMKACRKVMVTVVMDAREDPFTYMHPYQLFAISKQMVTALVKIAGEQHTQMEEPVYLYGNPVRRFEGNPELGFLESELFRYRGRQYAWDAKEPKRQPGQEDQSRPAAGEDREEEESRPAAEDDRQGEAAAVRLYSARNPREEAEYAAAQMRRLVRREGLRYRDMAVIASDMNAYAVHLEKACATYGIPIFMDHKKSILLNAFVEYVRSLLAMVDQKFSYESVFRFLRAGMNGFTLEEIDRLENYVIALGLKGYKKWQSPWVRAARGHSAEELEALNRLRVRFVEKMESLMFILQKRTKTVGDITLAVYEFFMQEKMQEQIRKLEIQFQEKGELALAKEYSQIYRIVIELFEKFVELLGDEKVSLKEYCELLDAGLEEAKVGVVPPSLDQVVIGDVERTRLNHLKVLFFVGANDTFLPGNLGKGGLLSERDREKFAQGKLPLSPGAKEKTYIQKFYLYMNLTKPSEKLYLSFSKVSSDGKALRPAYLVQDIRRLFPRLRIQEDMGNLADQEITWDTGAVYLARGLRARRQGLCDEWKELYSWYRRQEAEKKASACEGEGSQHMEPEGLLRDTLLEEARLAYRKPDWRMPFGTGTDRILDAAFYKKEPDCLEKEAAGRLFGDSSRASVTRLERFASCAYAHFLTYGLRLSEREEYGFESLDLGNIAHQSMERFARKADEHQAQWTELTEELRGELVDESVEESIVDYGNTVLYSSARNEYMVTRIKNLIRRSVWALTKQMERGDFQPAGYELKFGSGKIDRMDTCEDERHIYVKVTDYKTGMKSFDITAFYHGLQMQLPVYLNAALEIEKQKARHPKGGEEAGKEVVPAGIFYYRMQDPFVEKEPDDAILEGKILKELRLDGLINADDEVIGHLERDLAGTSNLLPVGRNKDGSLSKNSKVLPPEEFALFLEYAKEKERELKRQMAEGHAEAAPYELGGNTGCDYCAYHAVCGFDPRLDGYGYRRLEKYSVEEVMERIREYTDRNEAGESEN